VSDDKTTADAILVTVDGPPVSAKVTREQVRTYLGATGWVRDPRGSDIWTNPSTRSECDTLNLIVYSGNLIGRAVEWIATGEHRHPADVLRDIACHVGQEQLAPAAKPLDAQAPTCGQWVYDENAEPVRICGAPAIYEAVCEGNGYACAEHKCRHARRVSSKAKDDSAPLTEAELAAVEARDGSWSWHWPRIASGEWGTTPEQDAPLDRHRLLATVRALQEENTKLKERTEPMPCGHTRSDLVREMHATAKPYCAICRLHSEINDWESEDDDIRATIGPREDETTVDAVRRVVAERDEARLNALAAIEEQGAIYERETRWHLVLAARKKKAEDALRGLGIDPEAL
jgi:hypothetical protein